MTDRSKALSATFWSTGELLLGHGSRFAITVVLARLISPEEYGIVAILSLFIGISGALIDAGFTPVIIQRQDLKWIDESVIFWVNISMGISLGSIIFLSAPYLADFYEIEVIKPLTELMAFNIFISGACSVHRALLLKRLRFKSLMFISLISTVTSGCVAIYLAIDGFGVWALAAQTLAAPGVSAFMLYIVVQWRPKFAFSFSSLRILSNLGIYLISSALLEVIYSRFYTLIIGKIYGPLDLGYYVRADSTTNLPMTLTNSVLARVVFPMFSAIASDKERLRRDVGAAVQAATLINTPAMLGLAAIADTYVVLIFGETWRPSVPIVQILCIAGLFMPLHVISIQVLIATGRGQMLLKLEIFKKVVGILVLLVSSRFGIYGMAWGMVLSGAIFLAANAWTAGKLLRYGFYSQVCDVVPSITIGVVMALAVMLVSSESQALPSGMRLPLEVLTGIVVYCLGLAVWQPPAYKSLKLAVTRVINRNG